VTRNDCNRCCCGRSLSDGLGSFVPRMSSSRTRECSLASWLLCCHWVAHRSRRFLAETTAALVAESLCFILEFSFAGGAPDHGRPPSHELIKALAASPPPSSSAIAPTHARSPLRRLGSPAAHERKGRRDASTAVRGGWGGPAFRASRWPFDGPWRLRGAPPGRANPREFVVFENLA
jgi:hypothetical protein